MTNKENKQPLGHIIKEVVPDSIAMELEIEPGDKLLSINNHIIEDVFDYQYYVENECMEILIEKPNQEQWILSVEKEEDEDLGILFENGLMDEYRSCHNKCIFCFIDQMPRGMRETLYFKDDDSRLSFLQGNYVTLTNMSDHDIDRIIKYHLAPINISFQTMNPELRCKMLNNRFAGDALNKVDQLYRAGIAMNGQIVLCKGVNDGAELELSIQKLMNYLPILKSVSVVPVGLTKYREGLYPLEPFDRKDAVAVLTMIHKYQEQIYEKRGIHFIHASDEFYLLAGWELPAEETYDDYIQLENGVGMLRLLLNEFSDAMAQIKQKDKALIKKQEISMATGKLAYPYIQNMADEIMKVFPQITIHVYEITNNFFGEMITVAGLITGQDLLSQLKGQKLGTRLLLPQNMLRAGETVFLDDCTVEDLEKTLQVKVDIVKSSGYDFVNCILESEQV